MARTGMDSGSAGTGNSQETITFQANGQDRIELPSSDFISDAKMTRDGDSLVLQSPNGETVVIEGYFNADPTPLLLSADGATLTPNLVEAFARSPMEFAANGTATDESPVGAVEEVKGNATVTRADGTVETITIGTPIYQGDVVETDASGAVNIVFIDETSMAVSENARLAIDEYKYDPATESGTTNFSVLRGLFVFTSGLIGRDDPDDVSIDTPVGSIGIRGTVIAGDINPSGESKITVLEGAIVVKNGAMEVVLSEQFQTVTLNGFDQPMKDIGVLPAHDINTRFHSIGDVNPGLFSMIGDAVKEQSSQHPSVHDAQPVSAEPSTFTNESSPAPQSQGDHSSSSATDTPAAAPIVTDIVTLSGDTSSLPSIETATGQPSGGLTGSTATSPSASAGSTNHVSSLAAGAGGSSGTPSTTTTPEGSLTDPTQQLAPPAVNSNANNPGSNTPATPAGTYFTFIPNSVSDIAGEHYTIGSITGPVGVTMTAYTITSSNASLFSVVMTGNDATIELTQAGADYLGESFDVRQFGNIVLRGETADGAFIDITATVNVTNAHGAGDILNLDAPAQAAIITDNRNDMVGYTITALGDVTGDGIADFAVSKNTADDTQNMSFIISGSTGNISSGTLSSLPPIAISNHTESLGYHYGTSISGIGDFDGDGVRDYIIGQPGNRIGPLETGTAAIISGVNGSNNFLAPTSGGGLSAGDMFGESVSGIGDFNNDGYADVIIGAPGSNLAYFIAGREMPDYASSWTGNLPMMSESFSYTGTVAIGTSVTGLGDFNGDGYSDLAVGDAVYGANDGFAMIRFGNGASSSPLSTSSFTVMEGDSGQGLGLGQEVSSVGDINGDGLTDLLIGGEGNFGRIYFGNAAGAFGSHISLNISNAYDLTGGGGVGDFNGDGYDDFVLTFGDAGGTKAYVVYGKTSLQDIDISYLKNPDNAFEIRYSGANNGDDIEVSSIGDINGDGYDDFALGLPDANGGATGNGGFAIVYGRNTGAVSNGLYNANDDNQALVANGTNAQLSDGGFIGTSMRGGYEENFFHIENTEFLGIHGGGQAIGYRDTIVLDGPNDLDFSNVDFEKISGIERISFGEDNTTLTLTMENLFNLLKSSDTGTLHISLNGNSGNTLILTDSNGGDNYASGNEFDDIVDFLNTATGGSTIVNETEGMAGTVDTFQIGGYTLLIDHDLTVNAQ